MTRSVGHSASPSRWPRRRPREGAARCGRGTMSSGRRPLTDRRARGRDDHYWIVNTAWLLSSSCPRARQPGLERPVRPPAIPRPQRLPSTGFGSELRVHDVLGQRSAAPVREPPRAAQDELLSPGGEAVQLALLPVYVVGDEAEPGGQVLDVPAIQESVLRILDEEAPHGRPPAS